MIVKCRNGYSYLVEVDRSGVGFTAYEVSGIRGMYIDINTNLYNFNTLEDLTGNSNFDIMLVRENSGEIIYDREAGDNSSVGSNEVLYVNLNNRNFWW